MENLERFAFPAVVAAAVIGLWVALRKPAGAAGVVSGTGQVSPIYGTQTAPVLSPGTQAQAIAPLPPGAGGAGTSFTYIDAAGSNFYANNPVNPANPNSSPSSISLPPINPSAYLQTAAPPMSNLTKFVTLQVSPPPPADAGGCGGGCGGCSKNPCEQRGQSNRYSDGRGGCLTTRPKVGGLSDAGYNLDTFMGLFSAPPAWNWPPPIGVPAR